MTTVSDYVKHLLMDYMIPSDDYYIYEDLEFKLMKQIKELDLIPDYNSAVIAFKELGGTTFLDNEIIKKYNLYRFQKSSKVLLIISAITGPISIILFVIYGMLVLINAFTGGTYYNADGSFLGLFDANYISMFTNYWIGKTVVAFVVSIILLITDSIGSPPKNIILSLIIGIITLPFGIFLVIYGAMKYISNISIFKKQQHIKFGTTILLSIAIFTVLAIGLEQTKAHDEFLYESTRASIYNTDFYLYELTDNPMIQADEGRLHLQYTNEKLYYISINDLHIDNQEIPTMDDTVIDYSLVVNDFEVCSNSIDGSLNLSTINCSYEAASIENTVDFDINTIEVKIVIQYTNESNELIIQEIVVVTITDMQDHEFNRM